MDSNVFDKSKWPLATVGLHWCLNDYVKQIGRLMCMENSSTVVYEISMDDLPPGTKALHTFNALRNIEVVQRDFDDSCKIVHASLHISGTMIDFEEIDIESEGLVFQCFTDTTVLPMHALEGNTILVKIKFEEQVNCALLPKQAVRCEGLLFNIKDKSAAFFVGGTKYALLNWDGTDLHILPSDLYKTKVFDKPGHFDLWQPQKSAAVKDCSDEAKDYFPNWDTFLNSEGTPEGLLDALDKKN